MLPHRPMQIQCCPSGHNGKSENYTVWAYKDKLDLRKKVYG
jgi:hypothetical protein